MHVLCRISVSLFVWLYALSASSVAQVEQPNSELVQFPTTLGGTCIFSDGRPAADVLVQVFLLDTQNGKGGTIQFPGVDLRPTEMYGPSVNHERPLPLASVVTDENGEWRILGVPSQSSKLVTAQQVDRTGLQLFGARSIVSAGNPAVGVQLVLTVVNASVSASPPPFSSNVSNLYYATDRVPVSGPLGREYLDGAGSPGPETMGTCDVEIDKLHRVRCRELSQEATLAALVDAVKATQSKQLVVFVHGYNQSFDDAARSAAVLAKGTGRTVLFYDWASYHRLALYPKDEEEIDWSLLPRGLNLFRNITAKIASTNIIIFAHSMGSRIAYETMELFAENGSAGHPRKFNSIVIAAGDIFLDTFSQGFGSISNLTSNFDNYASSHDQALLSSEAFHEGDPRLGQTKPKMFVAPGLTSIDASAANTDWLGHGYFSDPALLEDIRALFDGDSISARNHLTPHGSSGYYDFHR